MTATAGQFVPGPPFGVLAEGVVQYVDPETGEIERIPYTGTPPFGEADLGVAVTEEPILPAAPNPTLEMDLLHEQVHGTPFSTPDGRGYDIEQWQNPSNPGIPNLGPVEGDTGTLARDAVVHHYQSDEQGWGMDPAVLLPRYPVSEGLFPGYSIGTHRRMGDLEWLPDMMPFGDRALTNVELQYQLRRKVSAVHGKLVDNPQAVPYSSTVLPVPGQAGPLNLVPEADEAIY